MTAKPVIGLALGSGSARGWSHIGVINALADEGIEPDVICGTSIGALVGAAVVAGRLRELEDWTRSLTRLETVRFFEINPSFNGFVNRKRFHGFLNDYVCDDETLIEGCAKRYAAVSTELQTGREVWFSDGPLIEAVWASISLPGLFPAIREDSKWLIDGGLVNPVPVSVCRALGADIVIAVNLNGHIVGKHFARPEEHARRNHGVAGRLSELVREYTGALFTSGDEEDEQPNLFDAIAGSINIAQDRITRSRMAGDPPDILLAPKLSHIGLLEFYRANDAMDEGRQCVQRMLPEIRYVLGMS